MVDIKSAFPPFSRITGNASEMRCSRGNCQAASRIRVQTCSSGQRWPSCLEPVKSLIRSQISLPTLNTAPTQPLQVYIVQVHSSLQRCYKYPVPTQDIALTQVPHRCHRVSGAQLGPELRRKSSLTPSLTASENPSRLISVKL